MAPSQGTRRGPYEIVSVYKATDTRLDRTVTTRCRASMPPWDPSSPQREVKTIAGLNHGWVIVAQDDDEEDDLDDAEDEDEEEDEDEDKEEDDDRAGWSD